MAFRTEMGLYYSYYKTMVDAPTWWEGFDELGEIKILNKKVNLVGTILHITRFVKLSVFPGQSPPLPVSFSYISSRLKFCKKKIVVEIYNL